MRFSVWPINQQPIYEILEVAKHADSTGWDGIWMADHLMGTRERTEVPLVECLTALSAIAVNISRLRIGSLVVSNTFRHPALLAKCFASIETIAPSRVVLGLGTGWQENEHHALGIGLPDAPTRLEMLEEACQVIRDLLDRGRSSFSGKHYRLNEAVTLPKPSSRVPLLLGLKGDYSLRLVARFADAWNLWATPAILSQRDEILCKYCENDGRDNREISRTAQALVVFDEPESVDPRWAASGLPLLTGGNAELQDHLGAFAEVGLDEIIVPDFSLGSGAQKLELLDRFFEDVARPFQTD